MPGKFSVSIFFTLFIIIPLQGGCASNLDKSEKKIPQVRIIEYSPEITRGGSAVVIFRAEGVNTNSLYIGLKQGKNIYPSPFLKKNTYLALLPWPFYEKDFKAFLIYSDLSGNTLSNPVPIPAKGAVYPEKKIKVGNFFSTNKIEELNLSKDTFPENKTEQYKLIMKNFNEKKVLNIAEAASVRTTNAFPGTDLNPFNPLNNSRITSPFGEHRIFTLHKRPVRDSYHFGLDLAGDEREEIHTSNPGLVIFAGYNGANGNMALLSHGFGLYSLYCHCSELFVKTGQWAPAGSVIARSGQTGYALGDHLHFSMLIYGIYVNPNEWMNREWIKENIADVMKNALTNQE